MHTPAQRPTPPEVTAAEPAGDPLFEGIHDRWEGQGLPGDPWPFLAMCSIGRLHHMMKKALEGHLKEHGLTRTGYFLLTTLALTGTGRARLTTLSRMLMMHPTSVTLTVDQLRRAGLVTRTPHPRDRRAALVQITDAGRDVTRAVNAALEAPGGPLAALDGHHREIFEALQPARLGLGDDEL
ncbi:MarR family winged helix-turn-helix transcriptional regulator [Actinomadura flavalba]|uniref:MarR family winged helix-turn-helix transcriptional regulator n=1 Tax=Actinomadura flavalba TaxID=1120938 RepID=UPI0004779D6F|nr:MarR family transcriptional regulator [Actinomadura flavalba]